MLQLGYSQTVVFAVVEDWVDIVSDLCKRGKRCWLGD